MPEPRRPAPRDQNAPRNSAQPTPSDANQTRKPRKSAPRDANATEVFAGFAQDKKRSGRLPARIGIIIGILLVCYLAGAVAISGVAPKGTSFAGVKVGGMPTDRAIKKLETELGPKLKAPLAVKLGEKTAQIDPTTAGLTADFSASVRAVTEFSLNPLRIMSHLTGTGAQPLKTSVDHQLLDQAVAKIAPQLQMAPHEADFQCVNGKLEPVKPNPGRALDLQAASEVLATQWWRDQPLRLPGTTTTPKTTVAQLEQAAAGSAKTLMSDPVKANIGTQTLEIPTGELCRAVTWKLESGKLAPQLDGTKLRDYAMSRLSGIETNPVDARLEFPKSTSATAGAPVVVPAKNGTKLTAEEMAAKLLAGAISPENREVTVNLAPIAPKFTTEDAKAAGITELIGEFDTALTSSAARTGNLRLGAAKVTGVMVKPGEEFSLEKTLGPITAENGWAASGVLNNGLHTTALGGGLSQMCVTTLNAAWFAGMDLVEFHPHSVWFSRYPEGRECTLWEGSLDLRWRNPNPKPVLLRGWVGGGRLHVQIWGTKHYQVETAKSERSRVRPPGKKVNHLGACVPSGPGHPGFTVSNTRRRLLDGKEHDTKTYTHTYQPDDQIVCAKDQRAVQTQEIQGRPGKAETDSPADQRD